MKKWIKTLLLLCASFLVVLLFAFFYLHFGNLEKKVELLWRNWAASQNFQGSFGSLERKGFFYWQIDNIHLACQGDFSIDVHTLQFALNPFSLWKGELALRHFTVDRLFFAFNPEATSPPFSLPLPFKSYAIPRFVCKELELYNLLSQNRQTFFLEGSLSLSPTYLKNHFSLTSPLLSLQGAIESLSKEKNSFLYSLKGEVLGKEAFSPFVALPSYIQGTLQGNFSVEGTTSWPLDAIQRGNKSACIDIQLKEIALQDFPYLDLSGPYHIEIQSNKEGWECKSFFCQTPSFQLKGAFHMLPTFHPSSWDLQFHIPHLNSLFPHFLGSIKGSSMRSSQQAALFLDIPELFYEYGPKKSLLFDKLSLEIALNAQEGNYWSGLFSAKAQHPSCPLQSQASLHLNLPQSLTIENVSLDWGSLHVGADISTLLQKKEIQGSLALEATTTDFLQLFFPESSAEGSLGGQWTIEGNCLKGFFRAENIDIKEVKVGQITSKMSLYSLLHNPYLELFIEAAKAEKGEIEVDQIEAALSWDCKSQASIDFQAANFSEKNWSLKAQADLDYTENHTHIQVNHAEGSLLQQPYFLKNHFSVDYSPVHLLITQAQWQIGKGFFTTAFQKDSHSFLLKSQADHFPLEVFQLISKEWWIEGTSSLQISLEGREEELQGQIYLVLEKALAGSKRQELNSKGSLQLHLQKNRLQLHSLFQALPHQFLEAEISLPYRFSYHPFHFSLAEQEACFGKIQIQGLVEQLFGFFHNSKQQAEGALQGELMLSGDLKNPKWEGKISCQKGKYRNGDLGLYLEDVGFFIQGEKAKLLLKEGKAEDKNLSSTGTISVEGNLNIVPSPSFSFTAKLHQLTLLQKELLQGRFSGNLLWEGNLKKSLLSGSISVVEAHLQIPENIPPPIPILPITFLHFPSSVKSAPLLQHELLYDVEIQTPKKLYLSGRGLKAELKGTLFIKGEKTHLEPQGALELVKGSFTLAGKEFILHQGSLSFAKNSINSLHLHVTGTLVLPSLKVFLTLQGPLNAVAVELHSSPSLPPSSILSYILFNRDVSELTAVEAAQLAYTFVSLSGGAKPSLLDQLRQSMRVDKLQIGSCPNNPDLITIQVGKYLTKGLMITLSQGAESSQIIVSLELKGGFVLQAETMEDDQSKFSLTWNLNY